MPECSIIDVLEDEDSVDDVEYSVVDVEDMLRNDLGLPLYTLGMSLDLSDHLQLMNFSKRAAQRQPSVLNSQLCQQCPQLCPQIRLFASLSPMTVSLLLPLPFCT